MNYPPYMRPKL